MGTMMHRLAPAQVPWVKAQPPDEPAPPTLAPAKPPGAGNTVLSVRILTDAVTNEGMNDLSQSHLYLIKKPDEFCFNAKKQ